jgi:hypothetical protein
MRHEIPMKNYFLSTHHPISSCMVVDLMLVAGLTLAQEEWDVIDYTSSTFGGGIGLLNCI